MGRKYDLILFVVLLSIGLLTIQAVAEKNFNQINGKQLELSAKEISKIESLYETVPVTQWVDYNGLQPTAYADWKSRQPEPTVFSARQVALAGNSRSGMKICVIVNTTLYDNILTSLNQYETDLINEGYTVEIITSSGGTPEDMRAFLQGKYAEGMEGCLLIGDLPIPWYETECWEELSHTEFPCDYYYMDLDGTFTDDDSDGLYDGHSGDLYPEIWVGRLTPSPMTFGASNEVDLLNNYFAKNHLYRTGNLPVQKRGLSFIEDDWAPFAISWDNDHGLTYDNRVLIYDEIETSESNYESHLEQEYESIFICAHSSSALHQFKSGENYGYTTNSEIKGIDPPAIFYNLFACSNSRYVDQNNMGGWYIFCQNYGLVSIGSTKTGAMLNFSYFYNPFGSCATIGESFRDWFAVIASGGFTLDELCWHYGMTLQGDPTLRALARQPLQISSSELDSGEEGLFYSTTLIADGGKAPLTWQIGSGNLPEGLNLDEAIGTISGTTDQYGDFSFSVIVSDACTYVEFSDETSFNLAIVQSFPCGDVNQDELVNILDAVMLINYLYKDGPDPVPMENAYIDNNDLINILDVVYLINNVYKEGPDPVCP